MAQTYGVAAENSAEPNIVEVDATEDESQALLNSGGDGYAKQNEEGADGNASLVSSISNLSNTIIGSGKWSFYLSFHLKAKNINIDALFQLQACLLSLWSLSLTLSFKTSCTQLLFFFDRQLRQRA